jgi:hypothetical protein
LQGKGRWKFRLNLRPLPLEARIGKEASQNRTLAMICKGLLPSTSV